MPFLGCKTLYIIVNFFLLISAFLNSSFFEFKWSSKNLSRETTQVFILLIRFPLQSLVSRNSLVLLRNSFLIFTFSSICLMVFASNIARFLLLFLQVFWYFPDWIVPVPSVVSLLPFYYKHGAFFSSKFHFNILAEDSNNFILNKVYLVLWFCKSAAFFCIS